MSNFGYFQLKANPGVWKLTLKRESRSSELYDVHIWYIVVEYLGSFRLPTNFGRGGHHRGFFSEISTTESH